MFLAHVVELVWHACSHIFGLGSQNDDTLSLPYMSSDLPVFCGVKSCVLITCVVHFVSGAYIFGLGSQNDDIDFCAGFSHMGLTSFGTHVRQCDLWSFWRVELPNVMCMCYCFFKCDGLCFIPVCALKLDLDTYICGHWVSK